MTRMLSRQRGVVLAACLVVLAAPRLTAQQDPKQQSGAPTIVSAKAIAEQLGAKLQPRDDDELRIGMSFTAVLESPEKLAELGLKGMHAGARVTVARVAPDKIRVEADEMTPVQNSAAAAFKVDAKGALVAPPK
ncbi:MAG TPA: hypothetical protein VGP84_19185 [Gemmatimonadaceae bacterium]|nr:hypothetical protein [Gemmatimonadaceae bacterium]